MKSIEFRGTALADLRAFPLDVKRDAGYQLDRIQRGKAADDVKPLTTVGPGVVEIRVWDEAGTFRVVYVAKLADAVYVLHAFQKKSKKGIATPKPMLDLIRSRLKLAREHYAEWRRASGETP